MAEALQTGDGLLPHTGEDTPLEDILDVAVAAGEDGEVNLEDVSETFGERAFGPVFLLLGLLSFVPPIGGIPGVPTFMGLTLFLFSVQMLVGRKEIWLPDVIRRQSLKTEKLRAVRRVSASWLEALDARIAKRLVWAVTGPARMVAAFAVAILSLTMIPLELIPFGVVLPGSAIALIGLALFARDGLLMLIALGIIGATLYVLFFVSPLGNWLGV
ncbi:MAG: exopolysaccharide biosynthesis protein [Litorimonas sp.]